MDGSLVNRLSDFAFIVNSYHSDRSQSSKMLKSRMQKLYRNILILIDLCNIIPINKTFKVSIDNLAEKL